MVNLILASFLFTSAPTTFMHEVVARDFVPIYRIKTPIEWEVTGPQNALSLDDSTQFNDSFRIEDIVITIHTFPSIKIAPEAQVQRWLKQLGAGHVTHITQGGFAGLLLESPTVIAIAMQLDPAHCRTLQKQGKSEHYLADYTIKATGPAPQIEKHRTTLLAFLKSFEFIEGIWSLP